MGMHQCAALSFQLPSPLNPSHGGTKTVLKGELMDIPIGVSCDLFLVGKEISLAQTACALSLESNLASAIAGSSHCSTSLR